MCQLATSCPSPDQPGHGSCVSTAMKMWAVDPRARQIPNEAYDLLYFNQIPVSHEIRSRLLFSVFNHACDSADGAQHMFGELLRKMDNVSEGDKNVAFDEQFADVENISVINEWF